MTRAALVAAVIAVAALPALAHDPYTSWRIPGTDISCCDNRDCAPVAATGDADRGWRIWLQGDWRRVPPDRVLAIPSPDGRAHACVPPGSAAILCFVPGSGSF